MKALHKLFRFNSFKAVLIIQIYETHLMDLQIHFLQKSDYIVIFL